MNTGDAITTAEQFDALPLGAVLLDNSGLALRRSEWRGWVATNGTCEIETSEAIRDGAPFVILYLPGHLPRPERVVKAEALREAAALVDAACPHEPDEHAEGSCDLCDFTFAVTAQLHECADHIEASEVL